jgi:uncharacterized 2Fe-2S/4Fe-4S cluster protein (DUF4445 family)
VHDAESGALSAPSERERERLRDKSRDANDRLACLARVQGDLTVTVPPESRLPGARPRKPFKKFRIPVDPAVSHVRLTLEPADRSAPATLHGRLRKALAAATGPEVRGPDLLAVAEFSRLPGANRSLEVTATLYDGREVVRLRPGSVPGPYGIALDLGTTSLVGFLCDLGADRIVAMESASNPQIAYGEDVISRISQVQKDPSKLPGLQRLLLDEVDRLIQSLCRTAGVGQDDIMDLVAVGNPTMQHFLLGLDPTSLGQAPYPPASDEGGEVRARDLGLCTHPAARLHLLPLISGFVGADTLAVLLTLSPADFQGTTLIVDVGTNGEVVLSRDGALTATSCATGPAFEGAQIRSGMRAGPGAIERVWNAPDTGAIHYRVIGREEGESEKPMGLCGSGVISAVSALLEAGVIREDGAFDLEHPHAGLRHSGGGGLPEMVLVPAVESGNGRDIVLAQADVRAVQLGKAALRTGIDLLMRDLGVQQVDRILLAGTFGNYIAPEEALHIGMLPPVAREAIESIGNAAGDGARLALFSRGLRAEASKLRHRIRVVELTLRPDFQETFVDALGF